MLSTVNNLQPIFSPLKAARSNPWHVSITPQRRHSQRRHMRCICNMPPKACTSSRESEHLALAKSSSFSASLPSNKRVGTFAFPAEKSALAEGDVLNKQPLDLASWKRGMLNVLARRACLAKNQFGQPWACKELQVWNSSKVFVLIDLN